MQVNLFMPNNLTMNEFAQRIRDIRGEFSRAEFSKMTGISERALVNYESGKTIPNMEVAARLCSFGAISPLWLILGEGPMTLEDDDRPTRNKKDRITRFDPAEELVYGILSKHHIKITESMRASAIFILREKIEKFTYDVIKLVADEHDIPANFVREHNKLSETKLNNIDFEVDEERGSHSSQVFNQSKITNVAGRDVHNEVRRGKK